MLFFSNDRLCSGKTSAEAVRRGGALSCQLEPEENKLCSWYSQNSFVSWGKHRVQEPKCYQWPDTNPWQSTGLFSVADCLRWFLVSKTEPVPPQQQLVLSSPNFLQGCAAARRSSSTVSWFSGQMDVISSAHTSSTTMSWPLSPLSICTVKTLSWKTAPFKEHSRSQDVFFASRIKELCHTS